MVNFIHASQTSLKKPMSKKLNSSGGEILEDKYQKLILNELKLIRQELQKLNEPKVVGPLVFHSPVPQPQIEHEEVPEERQDIHSAGERVSF